jgi:hypothetical protein
LTDVSEVHTASVIRLKMEAVCSSEALVSTSARDVTTQKTNINKEVIFLDPRCLLIVHHWQYTKSVTFVEFPSEIRDLNVF